MLWAFLNKISLTDPKVGSKVWNLKKRLKHQMWFGGNEGGNEAFLQGMRDD